MDDEMALRLLGDADQMDPRTLHRALGALLDLLDGPRGTGSPRGAFVVFDLKIGSLTCAVKPRDADPVTALSIEHTWTGIDLSLPDGPPTHLDATIQRHAQQSLGCVLRIS